MWFECYNGEMVDISKAYCVVIHKARDLDKHENFYGVVAKFTGGEDILVKGFPEHKDAEKFLAEMFKTPSEDAETKFRRESKILRGGNGGKNYVD